MDRRTFLKTAAVSGMAAMLFDRLAGAESAVEEKTPDLVAVRGGEPAAMLDAGLAALGGIKAFVKPGQTVVIKPNIGWDRTPSQAADTNPDLVGHLVKLCLDAGAKQVQVFDHTCDGNWKSCYKRSGIEKAVKSAGGTMICGNLRSAYVPVEITRGRTLKKGELFRAVQECDVFINVPVLKNHGGAILTAALKNLMGTIWDRRSMHGSDLQQAIADWATVRVPDLNIVDAYRAMQNGGPTGRANCRILKLKSLLISRDMVAIDTAAAKMLGIRVEAAQHIGCAEKLGLGRSDLAKLNIRKIVLEA